MTAAVSSNGTSGMGTNGTTVSRLPRPTTKRKPARNRKALAPSAPRLALGITVGMGVGIPGLTLALTTVAGRLAMAGHKALAVGITGVCGTVLAVSLSHLAWAVGNITRSNRWAAWALAVAIDLSIVTSEAVRVFAPGICDELATGIMVAVTLASMVLNVWAFLRHQ